ncbi:sensor histidine kinase [Streptomyces sp. NPDC127108]|uniref:sensor histidine kinase n=1 Tax=Streptomyces sp. NPDC127108 TaxID=3345361 RepID=UPI0036256E5C
MATLIVATATTRSVGPLISGSGSVSVAAVLMLTAWRSRRSAVLLPTMLIAAGTSLIVTFTYQGPARTAAANWWTTETLALMALVIFSVRRATVSTALGLSTLLATSIVLSPLRITMNVVPRASGAETLQLCLLWAIFAMAAAGIGVYLRSLDTRSLARAAAERRAERINLARDLHDYAAHDISAVVVLVEAAQVLAAEDPQQALDLLPEIGAAGVQALQAMDHTVQLLSEAPSETEREGSPGVAGDRASPATEDAEGGAVRAGKGTGTRRDLRELPSLIARFNRTGTPEAVLEMAEGVLERLSAEVSALGYRAIVEALTNVRRHAAAASRVDIALKAGTWRDGDALRISVTDDAEHAQPVPGLADRATGVGGTGISGLTDRVEALGGELTAGPRRPHGWSVSIVVPLPGEMAS